MSASGALSGVSGPAGMLPSGVSLTGGGGLEIAGLEWLGARAYDPMARGYLSTDPLAPVLGAGWDGNPYSYAGNNPLNATDPTGLRPLTDEELKAYDGSSRGAFAAVGDWMDEHSYIVGGVAVVAGLALMFVPGGQVAGLGLMSFGADVAIQKATTGEGNWAQSAAVGVTGALGGAGFAASRAAMATSSSLSRLGGYVAINAGVNGAAGAVGGGAIYAMKNGGVDSWRGLGGAMVGGGISGAVGGLAGPAGGTLAKAGGHSVYTLANGTAGRTSHTLWRMTALGSGGGIAGTLADKAITGDKIRAGDITWAAITGGGLTHLPGGPSPSSTLSQAAWTNTSTVSGLLKDGVNRQALLRSGGIGAGVSVGVESAKFLITGE